MQLFDGYQLAQEREQGLAVRVAQLLDSGKKAPKIAAILFAEDTGSQLYTRLKREAAGRVGIGYDVYEFSLAQPQPHVLQELVHRLNADDTVTGIIIQKPWRSTWLAVTGGQKSEFATWWHDLTAQIDPLKDVDGLHPSTLAAIEHGTWQQERRVLPATCAAVLTILTQAVRGLEWGEELSTALSGRRVIILGKSDLLGLPLSYVLHTMGVTVELLSSADLQRRAESGVWLHDADVVVSATGREGLVTGGAIRDGAIVIDVGEPRPDVDRASVGQRAAFLTPVPGGVGPMTVVSLLENAASMLRGG